MAVTVSHHIVLMGFWEFIIGKKIYDRQEEKQTDVEKRKGWIEMKVMFHIELRNPRPIHGVI